MSGRHKPLMHVIFLFPPAISPAFPHRSLLSPNHFKSRVFFHLKNHALSLLIQRVRLHWDSKHTSSLNKLDIHFSPTRRCLLANQMWLGVVTSRVSFRDNLKALGTSYWSSQPDCSQELTISQCTRSARYWAVLETELDPLIMFLWIISLDKVFLRKAGSASSCSPLQAPICPALKVSSCRRHVKPQQTCLAVLFCFPLFLPDSLCMTSNTGSQGYFSHTTSFSPLQILSS